MAESAWRRDSASALMRWISSRTSATSATVVPSLFERDNVATVTPVTRGDGYDGGASHFSPLSWGAYPSIVRECSKSNHRRWLSLTP